MNRDTQEETRPCGSVDGVGILPEETYIKDAAAAALGPIRRREAAAPGRRTTQKLPDLGRRVGSGNDALITLFLFFVVVLPGLTARPEGGDPAYEHISRTKAKQEAAGETTWKKTPPWRRRRRRDAPIKQ